MRWAHAILNLVVVFALAMLAGTIARLIGANDWQGGIVTGAVMAAGALKLDTRWC